MFDSESDFLFKLSPIKSVNSGDHKLTELVKSKGIVLTNFGFVCTVGSPLSSIKPENTNLRGSITVRPTSCLFCLDSAALLMLNSHQLYLFG